MKNKPTVYSTNCRNTFIQVAPDCPAVIAQAPGIKESKQSKEGDVPVMQTQARIQYDLLMDVPAYTYQSDDVLFSVYALQKQLSLSAQELKKAKLGFFASPKACFRASPLCKKFGWGVHFNKEGKMALFGMETTNYKELASDPDIKQVRAMRSTKKASAKK